MDTNAEHQLSRDVASVVFGAGHHEPIPNYAGEMDHAMKVHEEMFVRVTRDRYFDRLLDEVRKRHKQFWSVSRNRCWPAAWEHVTPEDICRAATIACDTLSIETIGGLRSHSAPLTDKPAFTCRIPRKEKENPVPNNAKFWLVWSPSGSAPPRYKHPTQAGARMEAERLARLHPGSEFCVLEAVCASQAHQVHTTELVDLDDDDCCMF